MNQKVKQHLTNYAISKGWEVNDETLMEILSEATPVYEEKISSHRWYDDYLYVVNINGMFIGYNGFYMTGDNSRIDMGLDYDVDTVVECVPEQVTTTIYKPVTL